MTRATKVVSAGVPRGRPWLTSMSFPYSRTIASRPFSFLSSPRVINSSPRLSECAEGTTRSNYRYYHPTPPPDLSTLSSHSSASESSCNNTTASSTPAPASRPPILAAVGTSVYPYGHPTDSPSHSLVLPSLSLKINDDEKEAWGFVVAPDGVEAPSQYINHAQRTASTEIEEKDEEARQTQTPLELSRLLLGEYRFSPTDSVSWPFLSTLSTSASGPPNLFTVAKQVSFKTRLELNPLSRGGFTDYTSRYYAKREAEDKLTLREHLEETIKHSGWEGENLPPTDAISSSDEGHQQRQHRRLEKVAAMLDLQPLLDLPLVGLSNGQTRRARIAKGLLSGSGSGSGGLEGEGEGASPEWLILEEPFAGLDPQTRLHLCDILHTLHRSRKPRISLILRAKDLVHPTSISTSSSSTREDANKNAKFLSWITHLGIYYPASRTLVSGARSEIENQLPKIAAQSSLLSSTAKTTSSSTSRQRLNLTGTNKETPTLVDLKEGNVSYGPREVLKGVSWKVKGGERWMLGGDNGSGKTTLLSLILGDHPRSYASDLYLFGSHRSDIATLTIQSLTSHLSPELSSSFPRKSASDPNSLTTFDAIATGFNAVFSYRKIEEEQRERLMELVQWFGSGGGEKGSGLTFIRTPSQRDRFLSTSFSLLPLPQQQFALFLRSIVSSPKLLILDEPFAGMDDEMVRIGKRWLDEVFLPSGSSSEKEKDTSTVAKMERIKREERAVIMVSHRWEEEMPEAFREENGGRRIRLGKGEVVEYV